MNQPIPKKQHFVPASYLAGFTNPQESNRLWVYSKQGDEPRPSTPKEEGYERYLYAAEQADGTVDKASVERSLASLDQQGASLIADIEAGHALTTQQQFDLSYYIAVLLVRNPLAMKNYEMINESLMREIMKKAADGGELERRVRDSHPDWPEAAIQELIRRMKRMCADGTYEVDFPKGFALQLFETALDLAKRLLEMRWLIFKTQDSQFFVSSDNPVFFGFEDRQAQRIVYGGLDRPEAHVTVALNQRFALRADRSTPQAKGVVAARDIDVRAINDRTILLARRWVYCIHHSTRLP